MPIKVLEKLKIPVLEVELPSVELPDFPPKPLPKLDDRQREVLRYALMDDLADVIPFAGDVASDMAYAELKRLMKPEEYERFVKENKWLPSVLAALKVFSE
ncbi:MAG: hypothetical protein QXZ51_06505 [Candidatus Bathyarchaeia archaeon]